MPVYRVYFLDPDNHISTPPVVMEWADDHEAAEKAKQFIDGKDIEVWEGTRFIAKYSRADAFK